MHYKIKGQQICSHNAAKPHSQPSKDVIELLRKIGRVGSILDLGCGKLRYSSHLYNISSNIYFADSRVQLEREQIIKGKRCSVKNFISQHYPSSKCIAIEDIQNLKENFDLIFCSNVLSAIPCEVSLNTAMSNIYNLLSDSGVALIVNQHRSSYFKKFEEGTPHLYGYLHQGRRGTSYYGIIDKNAIIGLASKHGFSAEVLIKGDRTFAYLTKHSNKTSQQDAA